MPFHEHDQGVGKEAQVWVICSVEQISINQSRKLGQDIRGPHILRKRVPQLQNSMGEATLSVPHYANLSCSQPVRVVSLALGLPLRLMGAQELRQVAMLFRSLNVRIAIFAI